MNVRTRARKRSKWAAGLLSLMVPGAGHMYLGLMFKGILLMLIFFVDITAIVYAATEGDNVLSVVMLSFLIPVIYFYNLFDALQSTEAVNDSLAASAERPPSPPGQPSSGEPRQPWSQPNAGDSPIRGRSGTGILMLAAAGIVVFILADRWRTRWAFESTFSLIGAIVLIGAGIGLWFWEAKGRHEPKP